MLLLIHAEVASWIFQFHIKDWVFLKYLNLSINQPELITKKLPRTLHPVSWKKHFRIISFHMCPSIPPQSITINLFQSFRWKQPASGWQMIGTSQSFRQSCLLYARFHRTAISLNWRGSKKKPHSNATDRLSIMASGAQSSGSNNQSIREWNDFIVRSNAPTHHHPLGWQERFEEFQMTPAWQIT